MRVRLGRGRFDAAIAVAVLHHLSSVRRREEAMRGLARALVPGGTALVTVWALEQENPKTMRKWRALDTPPSPSAAPSAAGATEGAGEGEGRDFLVPWSVPFHRPEAAAAARSALPLGGRVDETRGLVVLERFYHVFQAGELEALATRTPGLCVVRSVYDRSNWCVVVQRDG